MKKLLSLVGKLKTTFEVNSKLVPMVKWLECSTLTESNVLVKVKGSEVPMGKRTSKRLYSIPNCSWEKVLWAIGALVIVNLETLLGKNTKPQFLEPLEWRLLAMFNQANSR